MTYLSKFSLIIIFIYALTSCKKEESSITTNNIDLEIPPCFIKSIDIEYSSKYNNLVRSEFTYNSSNKIRTSKSIHGIRDENGYLYDTTSNIITFNYNLNGLLITSTNYSTFNNSIKKTQYEYDINKIYIYDINNGLKTKNITIESDNNGNPIKEYWPDEWGNINKYVWDNDNVIYQSFEYGFTDTYRTETTREFTNYINPKYFLSSKNISTTSKNLVSSEYRTVYKKNPDTTFVQPEHNKYIFNDEGFPIKRFRIREYDSGNDTTIFYYDYY